MTDSLLQQQHALENIRTKIIDLTKEANDQQQMIEDIRDKMIALTNDTSSSARRMLDITNEVSFNALFFAQFKICNYYSFIIE